jgi:hypothetical protein
MANCPKRNKKCQYKVKIHTLQGLTGKQFCTIFVIGAYNKGTAIFDTVKIFMEKEEYMEQGKASNHREHRG